MQVQLDALLDERSRAETRNHDLLEEIFDVHDRLRELDVKIALHEERMAKYKTVRCHDYIQMGYGFTRTNLRRDNDVSYYAITDDEKHACAFDWQPSTHDTASGEVAGGQHYPISVILDRCRYSVAVCSWRWAIPRRVVYTKVPGVGEEVILEFLYDERDKEITFSKLLRFPVRGEEEGGEVGRSSDHIQLGDHVKIDLVKSSDSEYLSSSSSASLGWTSHLDTNIVFVGEFAGSLPYRISLSVDGCLSSSDDVPCYWGGAVDPQVYAKVCGVEVEFTVYFTYHPEEKSITFLRLTRDPLLLRPTEEDGVLDSDSGDEEEYDDDEDDEGGNLSDVEKGDAQREDHAVEGSM